MVSNFFLFLKEIVSPTILKGITIETINIAKGNGPGEDYPQTGGT